MTLVDRQRETEERGCYAPDVYPATVATRELDRPVLGVADPSRPGA